MFQSNFQSLVMKRLVRMPNWVLYLEQSLIKSDIEGAEIHFKDIEKAKLENKTAIFFGFQNCSPIEDDIGLIEKVGKVLADEIRG